MVTPLMLEAASRDRRDGHARAERAERRESDTHPERTARAWHQRHLAELNHREAELSRRAAEMEVFAQREIEMAERLRDCEAQELALDQREAKGLGSARREHEHRRSLEQRVFADIGQAL